MLPRFGLPVLLLVVGCYVTGCGPSPAAQAKESRQAQLQTADVNLPPKELVERVMRVVSSPPLSLGVVEHDKGTVVTGWKRYRGDWHIGRHWQERTRYRIEVSPDWDEPTSRSRLSVVAETEQRAAEGQRWDREVRVARPARAREVKGVIVEQVRGRNDQ
jgi:hypothetical protein